jgi:hypothetical protein
MEVYLSGAWHTFDPRNNAKPFRTGARRSNAYRVGTPPYQLSGVIERFALTFGTAKLAPRSDPDTYATRNPLRLAMHGGGIARGDPVRRMLPAARYVDGFSIRHWQPDGRRPLR